MAGATRRMKRCDEFRVGLEPHQVPQARELVARDVGACRWRRGCGQRVERRAGRARDRRRRTRRSSCASLAIDCASACARGRRCWSRGAAPARVLQPLANQRQHRLVALGRQVEPRQRGRHDFGRGRLEIQQQAQRVGEIEVGEVAAGPCRRCGRRAGPAGSCGAGGLPRAGLEIEHRARELREHDPRDARIERGEQRRDVAELLRQRVVAGDCAPTSSSVSRSSIAASVDGSSTRSARSTSETDGSVRRDRAGPSPCRAGRGDRSVRPARRASSRRARCWSTRRRRALRGVDPSTSGR